MKYKVGQKVRVIAENNGHEFEIGEEVVIIKSYPTNFYDCKSIKFPREIWSLDETEMEKLYTKSEVESIANKVMNLGMELRQNQLQGLDDDRSGNEVLEEYLKTI